METMRRLALGMTLAFVGHTLADSEAYLEKAMGKAFVPEFANSRSVSHMSVHLGTHDAPANLAPATHVSVSSPNTPVPHARREFFKLDETSDRMNVELGRLRPQLSNAKGPQAQAKLFDVQSWTHISFRDGCFGYVIGATFLLSMIYVIFIKVIRRTRVTGMIPLNGADLQLTVTTGPPLISTSGGLRTAGGLMSKCQRFSGGKAMRHADPTEVTEARSCSGDMNMSMSASRAGGADMPTRTGSTIFWSGQSIPTLSCASFMHEQVQDIRCSAEPTPYDKAAGRTSQIAMCDGLVTHGPPEKLFNLLLQCSIQAQLSHHNEFKNEIKAQWLAAFLGHEHIAVKRVSDRTGGGVLQYRGLSNGLRCSARDYLSTMLKAKPETFTVEYRVGRPDPAGMAAGAAPSLLPQTDDKGGLAGDIAGLGDPAMWESGRAYRESRGKNPYLKKSEPQYRSYTEVVDPGRVARNLMSINAQIADEWSADLKLVAAEGCCIQKAILAERPEGDEVNRDVAVAGGVSGVNVSQLIADPKQPLPNVLSEAFRSAQFSWNDDSVDAPSPFRSQNFDLLQRAVTREAALAAVKVLSASNVHAPTVEWLKEKTYEWLPRFEAPNRSHLASLFLLELLTPSVSIREITDDQSGETRLTIADTTVAAAEVLKQRQRVALDWSTEIQLIHGVHTELFRERLEASLSSEVQ